MILSWLMVREGPVAIMSARKGEELARKRK
jgi:hypothetical protein